MGTMAMTRRYHDGCAIATALDYIGERWAMLVVRELLLGPKRFTDLQAGLPGAGPKILAQRLRELENAGVLRRRTLAPPASSQVYELTEWGTRLDAVVVALGRWGADAPEPSGDHVGADSAMIKLRSFFHARQPWSATYEMRLGRYRFTVRVVDGELVDVSRGEPQRPDTVIDTDPDTLDELIDVTDVTDVIDAVTDDVLGEDQALTGAFTGAFTEALAGGRLTVTGDEDAARRLFASVGR
jgi:DNA-binding HxlR family transcriptional regulator